MTIWPTNANSLLTSRFTLLTFCFGLKVKKTIQALHSGVRTLAFVVGFQIVRGRGGDDSYC